MTLRCSAKACLKKGAIAEGFEAQGQWAPLGTGSGAPDRLEASASAAHSGEGGLAFSWTETFGGELRGIHLSPVPLPLPAIGGAGLEAGELLRIEQGRASIPVQVMTVSDLFPTVTDFRRPFLLLDVENYLAYLRLLPPGSLKTNPQEIWLSLSPGHDREAVIESIRDELPPYVSVTDRQEAAVQAAANPLAGGGWDGLTGLSMAGIGLAVVTVLLMHSVASVRAGSVDTAVARALGMSNRQLLMSLAAERWLMAGAAIAAGAAIGYWPGLELVQAAGRVSQQRQRGAAHDSRGSRPVAGVGSGGPGSGSSGVGGPRSPAGAAPQPRPSAAGRGLTVWLRCSDSPTSWPCDGP